jgi:hypothetical protein
MAPVKIHCQYERRPNCQNQSNINADLKMPEVPPFPDNLNWCSVPFNPFASQPSCQKPAQDEVQKQKDEAALVMPTLGTSLSPDEVYRLESAAENAALQKPLLQLLELGFTNFARNKELL